MLQPTGHTDSSGYIKEVLYLRQNEYCLSDYFGTLISQLQSFFQLQMVSITNDVSL